MSLQAVVGVVVFASVMGIWVGAAVSIMIEREQGVEAADQYNTRILLGIVAFVLLALVGSLLASFLGPSHYESVPVFFTISQLALIGGIGGYVLYIIWYRWRLAREELLLDAGRNKPSIYSIPVLLGGYLLLDLFFQLIRAILNNERKLELYPELLGSLLLLGLLILGFVTTIFYKVYFIKDGILLFRARPIKWEQIRDYSWGHRKKNKVTLILKGGKRYDFSIDIKYKAQVDEILTARIGGQKPIPVEVDKKSQLMVK